jgi:hypothetical protein
MGTLIFCQKIPSLAGMTAKVRKERKILSPLPAPHTHTLPLSLSLSLLHDFTENNATVQTHSHWSSGILTKPLKAYYNI